MLMTTAEGRRMFWNGHLCEGTIMPGTDLLFLWTRCRQADVPAGEAELMEPGHEITCPDCAKYVLNQPAASQQHQARSA